MSWEVVSWEHEYILQQRLQQLRTFLRFCLMGTCEKSKCPHFHVFWGPVSHTCENYGFMTTWHTTGTLLITPLLQPDPKSLKVTWYTPFSTSWPHSLSSKRNVHNKAPQLLLTRSFNCSPCPAPFSASQSGSTSLNMNIHDLFPASRAVSGDTQMEGRYYICNKLPFVT